MGEDGISENTISGNGGQAIIIEVEDEAVLPIATIVDNDLSGNTAGPDLAIISTSQPPGNLAACLIVRDNLAPMGIEFTGADPVLTGGVSSVSIQDLPTLLSDINITFFEADGATPPNLSLSSAPFQDEAAACIP